MYVYVLFTSSFAPAAMLMNESLALEEITEEEKKLNSADMHTYDSEKE